MDNGKDLNTQEELSKFISNFYQELYYNADPMTPEVQVARAECGESVVPTKVTPDMNEELTKTISREELSKAILALPKGKALGEDGLRTESFQKTLRIHNARPSQHLDRHETWSRPHVTHFKQGDRYSNPQIGGRI